MIKAVLFDLDGTLLNTLEDIRYGVNSSLSQFGYPPISIEQTRSYVGVGARMLMRRALPNGASEEEVEECYRIFKSGMESATGRTQPYEGAVEVLKRLKSQGLKLGVVTNKPQGAAEAVLKACLPEIEFDSVCGDTGDFPVKPDPTIAYYCGLNMRIFPNECVLVGDGDTDVQTAINAGMVGVACTWGFRTREQLKNAGATLFAGDFYELEKILYNILKAY